MAGQIATDGRIRLHDQELRRGNTENIDEGLERQARGARIPDPTRFRGISRYQRQRAATRTSQEFLSLDPRGPASDRGSDIRASRRGSGLINERKLVPAQDHDLGSEKAGARIGLGEEMKTFLICAAT